ncbi:HAMP domain-containing sensor histidine kinase [Sphingomonas sp. NFR15]|uniref:sensor histidine kinase n=1 Tax=Sphingomonas sp. NFR15 TaxID=1566282 RepID=UPI0008912049|nr:HAMP domain-containing sensor histidine kinase [Sphingomonas sp. NFR15]SDA10421.1 Histidine kinase-, DNA gyrase B-, and HSP90-like ATPase [Sphingomonas sp. NFR15]
MYHKSNPQARATPVSFASSPPQRQAIHDLRNLFGIVVAAKNILARDPAQTQRITLLEAIEHAAIQGGRLTSDLLRAGDHPPSCQAIDVGVRLAGLAPMMNALAGSRIEFDLEIGVPESRSRIDPAAFDASVLELIANAHAAHARTILVRSARVGARLWILICDDGRGMAPDVRERARRGADTGSARGAGLSRVHDFVRASHGHLHIRSRTGRGTAVAIILPTLLSIPSIDRRARPFGALSESRRGETVQQRVARAATA